MKLPCAVVRDLLPLYAEKLTEEETRKMVDEHLEVCAKCRKRLAEIDTKTDSPVESTKPLNALKREIRKRRWYTAVIAALCVFVGLYTYFYHTISMKIVPWQEGLIEVARVETINPAEYFSDNGHVPENDEAVPAPTVAPASAESGVEALVLNVSSFINGFQEHVTIEDDGTTTVIMQAISTNPNPNRQTRSYYEQTYYPIPDRLIYGFEQPQKLLWGPPLNSGTEILPRLALSYYLIIAAALAVICGLAWAVFRKWRHSGILRQLFFVPVSYILSHLLLKRLHNASFFMERDFISILLLAIALHALLSLAWQVFLKRRKEV